jgi:serine/threonine protein kinase
MVTNPRHSSKLPPHDNVMEVYGAIIDADSPSLVLEYCGGGKYFLIRQVDPGSDLASFLGSLDFLLYDSEEPISEEDMLKLALGVARGMEHLHKYNIVHRDLAARNVLVSHSSYFYDENVLIIASLAHNQSCAEDLCKL